MYGAAVLALPLAVQIGLRMNMPRIHAKRKIYAGKVDWKDPDSVYDLYYRAYGDKETAEEARFESLKFLIDEKCQREQPTSG